MNNRSKHYIITFLAFHGVPLPAMAVLQQNLNFFPLPQPHGEYSLICLSETSFAVKSRLTSINLSRCDLGSAFTDSLSKMIPVSLCILLLAREGGVS